MYKNLDEETKKFISDFNQQVSVEKKVELYQQLLKNPLLYTRVTSSFSIEENLVNLLNPIPMKENSKQNKIYTPIKFFNFEFLSNGIGFTSETIFHVLPNNIEEQLNKLQFCSKWIKSSNPQGTKISLNFKITGPDNSFLIGNICSGEFNIIHWKIQTDKYGELFIFDTEFKKIEKV